MGSPEDILHVWYIMLYFAVLDIFQEYFGYHVVPWVRVMFCEQVENKSTMAIYITAKYKMMFHT
jgi:hypothetical protein